MLLTNLGNIYGYIHFGHNFLVNPGHLREYAALAFVQQQLLRDFLVHAVFLSLELVERLPVDEEPDVVHDDGLDLHWDVLLAVVFQRQQPVLVAHAGVV